MIKDPPRRWFIRMDVAYIRLLRDCKVIALYRLLPYPPWWSWTVFIFSRNRERMNVGSRLQATCSLPVLCAAQSVGLQRLLQRSPRWWPSVIVYSVSVYIILCFLACIKLFYVLSLVTALFECSICFSYFWSFDCLLFTSCRLNSLQMIKINMLK